MKSITLAFLIIQPILIISSCMIGEDIGISDLFPDASDAMNTDGGMIQDTDLILGRWDIEEALRSGRPTESLDELFFEFYEEGKMRTNITGSTVDGSYKINGDQLHQSGTPLEVDYTIQTLSDSMLILTTLINKLDFRLQFSKTVHRKQSGELFPSAMSRPADASLWPRVAKYLQARRTRICWR